jgi:hypothetical protein
VKACIILNGVAAIALTIAITDGILQRRKLEDAQEKLHSLCEVVGERLTSALGYVDGPVAFDRLDYSMRVQRMVGEIRACTPPDAFDGRAYDRAYEANDYTEMKRQITTAVAAIKEAQR